jgi:hypothetical protein
MNRKRIRFFLIFAIVVFILMALTVIFGEPADASTKRVCHGAGWTKGCWERSGTTGRILWRGVLLDRGDEVWAARYKTIRLGTRNPMGLVQTTRGRWYATGDFK